MNCPGCGGMHTQKIEQVVLHGTSTGKSIGVGIGSSGLAAGVGLTKTTSAQVSQLLPGTKPTPNRVLGMFFLGAAITIFLIAIQEFMGTGTAIKNLSNAAVPGIAALIMGYAGFFLSSDKGIKEKLNVWEEKDRMYYNGWLCHSCGRQWIP